MVVFIVYWWVQWAIFVVQKFVKLLIKFQIGLHPFPDLCPEEDRGHQKGLEACTLSSRSGLGIKPICRVHAWFHPQGYINQVWCHTPTIPALEKWRQKNQGFKVSPLTQ